MNLGRSRQNYLMIDSVAVVCRANKVRSRITEAILLANHPNVVIKSFGTSPEKSGKVEHGFIALMDKWGIALSSHAPKSIALEIDFIRSADLVIAADSHVFSQIIHLNQNTINLADFAIDPEHVPVDPVGMSRDLFLQNVAKTIHCSRRLSDSVKPTIPPGNQITLLVPRIEDFVFEPRIDSYYINANFIKKTSERDQGVSVHLFEENTIVDRSILNTVNSKTRWYEAKYEFNRPEMILNSAAWHDFVREVASFGSTYVITEPLTAGSTHLWKSYLASHLADEIRYL